MSNKLEKYNLEDEIENIDEDINDNELDDVYNEALADIEEEEVEIEKNQLRDRAKKLDDVDDETWEKVLEENKYMMEEYFASKSDLSPATMTQYKSGIRIFLVWNLEHNRNKPLHKITKRDFMKYIAFLTNRELSVSAIKFKKSSVSSFCNFIELIMSEEEEDYRNFRNFAEKLPMQLSGGQVYEKKLITQEEYELIMKTLEEKGDLRGMCWVALAFTTGARRGELMQFKRDILDTPYEVDKDGKELNYKMTDHIRGKGKGREGKKIKFMIPRDVIPYIEKLVESEKGEHNSKYLFTTRYKGKASRISLNWANDFCRRILSPIVGRRINPHLFKASAITHQLMDGKDIKAVSLYIAHHNDISTTNIYDLRDDSEARNSLF